MLAWAFPHNFPSTIVNGSLNTWVEQDRIRLLCLTCLTKSNGGGGPSFPTCTWRGSTSTSSPAISFTVCNVNTVSVWAWWTPMCCALRSPLGPSTPPSHSPCESEGAKAPQACRTLETYFFLAFQLTIDEALAPAPMTCLWGWFEDDAWATVSWANFVGAGVGYGLACPCNHSVPSIM